MISQEEKEGVGHDENGGDPVSGKGRKGSAF